MSNTVPTRPIADSSNAAASTEFVHNVVDGSSSTTAASVSAVMSKLANNNANINIVVLGDSTGDSVSEWVYLTGVGLGAAWPEFTIKYRPWNNSTFEYTPANEITISVGTGIYTLTLWNASIAGKSANYFSGDHFWAAVSQLNPDLVILNYGHNGGTNPLQQTSYMSIITTRIAREVMCAILIVGQNPTTSGGVDDGYTQPIVEAFSHLAGRENFGFINIYDVFIQSDIPLSILVPDGVHPGAQGQALWTNAMLKIFQYSNVASLGPGNPSQAPKCIVAVTNYSEFVSRFTILGTAVLTKNTTNYETYGHSTTITTTAGSGWIFADLISSEDIIALRNTRIIVAIRIQVAAGQSVDPGRIEIDDGVTTTITSDGGPQGVEFYWQTCIHTISGTATKLRVYIFGSSNATNSTINVDRLLIGEGSLPEDYIPVQNTVQRNINIVGASSSGIGSFYNGNTTSSGIRGLPTETANVSTQWTSDFSADGFAAKQTADSYARVYATNAGIYFGAGAAAPSLRIAYRLSDGLGTNGHWYPESDNTYSLGANGLTWRNLYLSTSIYINSVQCLTGQGVAVADSTGAGDIVAQFNKLLTSLRNIKIIAT